MGKQDDELRELLVELAYDELPAEQAAAARAGLDEEALRTLEAFRAVRRDLRECDDVEPAPGRIAFVALRPPPTGFAAWSAWGKGLAVAASFVAGLLLTAAIVNLQIRHDATGWSLRAGLWQRSATGTPTGGAGEVAGEPSERPGGSVNDAAPARGQRRAERAGAAPALPSVPVGASVTTRARTGGTGALLPRWDLDRWLDGRSNAAAAVSIGGSRRPAALRSLPAPTTAGGDLARLRPLLEQLLAERDARLHALVEQTVAASEERQRQQFGQALTELYHAFDAQRTNDLLYLANELGLLQENTGLELQRANAAIDYLLTRVAAAPAEGQRRDR